MRFEVKLSVLVSVYSMTHICKGSDKIPCNSPPCISWYDSVVDLHTYMVIDVYTAQASCRKKGALPGHRAGSRGLDAARSKHEVRFGLA